MGWLGRGKKKEEEKKKALLLVFKRFPPPPSFGTKVDLFLLLYYAKHTWPRSLEGLEASVGPDDSAAVAAAVATKNALLSQWIKKKDILSDFPHLGEADELRRDRIFVGEAKKVCENVFFFWEAPPRTIEMSF